MKTGSYQIDNYTVTMQKAASRDHAPAWRSANFGESGMFKP